MSQKDKVDITGTMFMVDELPAIRFLILAQQMFTNPRKSRATLVPIHVAQLHTTYCHSLKPEQL